MGHCPHAEQQICAAQVIIHHPPSTIHDKFINECGNSDVHVIMQHNVCMRRKLSVQLCLESFTPLDGFVHDKMGYLKLERQGLQLGGRVPYQPHPHQEAYSVSTPNLRSVQTGA